jgi:Spy/CpxP family protein refolding chaperone
MKPTIKLPTFLLLLMAWPTFALAQPERNTAEIKEKVDAYRIAFLTDKLELTTTEAEKFWPVYHAYRKEMDQVLGDQMDEMRALRARKNEAQNLSDAEIESKIQETFSREEKVLKIKRNYHEKFKKVLPVKKVGQLYLAEVEFKKALLRKMREEKGKSGPLKKQ